MAPFKIPVLVVCALTVVSLPSAAQIPEPRLPGDGRAGGEIRFPGGGAAQPVQTPSFPGARPSASGASGAFDRLSSDAANAGGAGPSQPGALGAKPDLHALADAIRDTQTRVNRLSEGMQKTQGEIVTRINAMSSRLDGISQKMDGLGSRLSANETRMQEMSTASASLSGVNPAAKRASEAAAGSASHARPVHRALARHHARRHWRLHHAVHPRVLYSAPGGGDTAAYVPPAVPPAESAEQRGMAPAPPRVQ